MTTILFAALPTTNQAAVNSSCDLEALDPVSRSMRLAVG